MENIPNTLNSEELSNYFNINESNFVFKVKIAKRHKPSRFASNNIDIDSNNEHRSKQIGQYKNEGKVKKEKACIIN